MPRILACRFSSATLGWVPANAPDSDSRYASKGPVTGITSTRIPRRRATSVASSKLSGEEYREGIATVRTPAGPSASAATEATSAESIPPDRPMTTSPKPFLRT